MSDSGMEGLFGCCLVPVALVLLFFVISLIILIVQWISTGQWSWEF
ncbi:hypothetical protein OOK31_10820 [Streptomyces sp. NBC_00249]|nr:hypothetical protein [Streptomyces sp. NBC_00249]MCX5194383.1 hypothetical protein [Streptomyces sp. NBC_00249]